MAKGEALRKWREKYQYKLVVDMNRNSDADRPLIEKLESVDNKAQYVKKLIRNDIESGEGDK